MPFQRRRLLTPLLLLFPAAFAACSEDPVDPPVEEGHAFTYTAPAGSPAVTAISVRGTFNEWGEAAMTRGDDGTWRVVVDIPDGTYEYKFFINGAWPADMCHDTTWGHAGDDFWIDPDAQGCVTDGHGGQNAVMTIGELPALLVSHDPAAPVYASVADGRLSVRLRATRGRIATAAAVVGTDTFPMHLQMTQGLQEVWRGSLPEGTTSYRFAIRAEELHELGPYDAPSDPFTAVSWVGEGVGYQIFPERFWNGDPSNDSAALATDVVHYMHPATWDEVPVLSETWGGALEEFHCCHQYFGGDLQGIIDRLDHLSGLGVTLIYMNPIFTSGSAHGYDIYNFMEIAPNFGDTTVLRQLIVEAEARGMRLMWDFVPNHVGVGHWAFQHAVANGTDSPYWDWFNFLVAPGDIQVGNGNHYETWWGFGTLPRLETRNAEVMERLMDVTRHWTEFGLDGIRVDVPFDIRNRSEFFPAFRAAAKGVDPEVYLIGEIWERDPSWLQGDEFDGLMNYAIGEGVVERFAGGHATAGAAAGDLATAYAEYPEAATAMLFNLVASHDTGRLLTKLGGGALGGTPSTQALARQRLASAFLFALPGIPVTFQGDECAFLGTGEGPRAENRYPFQWDACDAAMHDHYARLAQLRTATPALRSAAIRTPTGSGSLLSFFRGEPGPGEILVVLNNAAGAATLALPAGTWVDVDSGESLTGSVSVSGYGWRYLRGAGS